ncbi:MAG: DNA integrity scanning protein DisA nucleotide-binding domain protein [Planctomycetaceae bacterium]|jgi:DNA integrity scanning protein DisA with diadenylate cyclase activity|nr:DNA integrity scanning protein DisA nucleotide-binding domain protein [Planctomycetaceae bacterium]
MLEPLRFTDQFRRLIGNLRLLREELEAAAVIVFPESILDWTKFRKALEDENVIVAATNEEILKAAAAEKFPVIRLHSDAAASIHERISHAVLEAVADDLIPHGSRVLSFYSAMDPASLDSVSVVNLGEHLDRLSGRDLRQLESSVPLKTLKTVVDIAVDIGYEGREGSPIGALFVVGDSKKVLSLSRSAGFDPVKGYHRKERTLFDVKVREAVKEIAQLDGAIIVSADGVVEAAARILESKVAMLSLSPGLGARHFAAAAISRATSAIAVAISQSSGTVRIFRNGEVALRVESRQRQPLVWQDLKGDYTVDRR